MADEAPTAAFDEEMLRIYQRALAEADYNASRFLQSCMNIVGWKPLGFYCIRRMFQKDTRHCGSAADCTLQVEAVIHDNPKWHPLFTAEDLAICTKRLKE